MKRVVSFEDYGKSACEKLNEWLRNHPDVTLIDIKPVLSSKNHATLYAIVELEKTGEGERE